MSISNHRDKEADRETDIIKSLISASGTVHHDFDGSGSLHATAKTKSNYPIILKAWDWKINV
jgi:hypothetical protein